MDTNYKVNLAITLSPQIIITPPEVLVSVPGHTIHKTLWKTKHIELEFVGNKGFLEVQFLNKNYSEITPNKDMAVIIDSVEFFGISDPRFVWAGVYCPKYPEPWYSQQSVSPSSTLTNCNYLGWNGVWKLEFDVPVFTWMHQTLGMGWIYS